MRYVSPTLGNAAAGESAAWAATRVMAKKRLAMDFMMEWFVILERRPIISSDWRTGNQLLITGVVRGMAADKCGQGALRNMGG